MWLTAMSLIAAFLLGWIMAAVRLDKKAQEQCLECITMRGVAHFADQEK
ncbi:hypothetical protein [Carboxydocella sp. ULO1]|nr:hypothetical protein [Carboxydocella sp. ULO1]GAW28972.1 hypothetical protein ULO1_15420 [Carboxydocella sp. ULO1]